MSNQSQRKQTVAQWEWQDGYTSSWKKYASATTLEIEKAYIKYKGVHSSTSKLSLAVAWHSTMAHGNTYEIDFVKMTQTNVKSKFSRKIRRLMVPSVEQPTTVLSGHKWCLRVAGSWKEYSTAVSAGIEKCYQARAQRCQQGTQASQQCESGVGWLLCVLATCIH